MVEGRHPPHSSDQTLLAPALEQKTEPFLFSEVAKRSLCGSPHLWNKLSVQLPFAVVGEGSGEGI